MLLELHKFTDIVLMLIDLGLIEVLLMSILFLFIGYYFVFAQWLPKKLEWEKTDSILKLVYRKEQGTLFEQGVLFCTARLIGYLSFLDLIFFKDALVVSSALFAISLMLQFSRFFKKIVVIDLNTAQVTLTKDFILFHKTQVIPLKHISSVLLSREKRFLRTLPTLGLRWVFKLELDLEETPVIEIFSQVLSSNTGKVLIMLQHFFADARVSGVEILYVRDDVFGSVVHERSNMPVGIIQEFGPLNEEDWRREFLMDRPNSICPSFK